LEGKSESKQMMDGFLWSVMFLIATTGKSLSPPADDVMVNNNMVDMAAAPVFYQIYFLQPLPTGHE
jgi:hypothetical protein